MNKILKTMLLVGGLFALTTTGAKAQSNEGDNRGYSVKVGDMAPDFTLQYLDGTTICICTFIYKNIIFIVDVHMSI